jgi:hypothetical protein
LLLRTTAPAAINGHDSEDVTDLAGTECLDRPGIIVIDLCQTWDGFPIQFTPCRWEILLNLICFKCYQQASPNTESSVSNRIWANAAPHQAGNTVQYGLARSLLALFYSIFCETNEGQSAWFQVCCFHCDRMLLPNARHSIVSTVCTMHDAFERMLC